MSYALLVLLLIAVSALAAPKKPLDGQIVADPANPSWLKRHGGAPFFLAAIGDPEGFLYRGKRNSDGTRVGDQMTIIRKLARYGGNGIYMIAVRTHGGDAGNDVKTSPSFWPDELHNPWNGQDPKKGLNEAVLRQWESWFSEMDRNGIVTYFFFYDDAIKVGQRFGWALDANGRLHPEEKQFIQTLVKRFQHHRNLIWCVMEEGQEIGADWKRHVSAIAEAIAEADEHGHVIASHQLRGNTFFHAGDPNITQFAIQTDEVRVQSKASFHDFLIEAWRRADGRYSLNMSEDPIHPKLVLKGDRTAVRQRNWAAAMAGSYVMVLGLDGASTPDVWLADLRQLQHFFEGTDLRGMAPSDELKRAHTEYVLAAPGSAYILYSSDAGKSLGIGPLRGGVYDLKWFDCITGRTVEQKALKTPEGDRQWNKPEGLGPEVALYVKRRDPSAVADRSSGHDGAAARANYFPPPDAQGGWRIPSSPAEVRSLTGLDQDKLEEAFRYIQGSTKHGGLLVARHGWLVYEKYFGRGQREATPNTASCGKSFTSVAMGILMHERPDLFPDGLDQKVYNERYLPKEAFPLTDPGKADIKLGQLLAMTAGIRGNNPGYVQGRRLELKPAGPDGWPACVDTMAFGHQDGERNAVTLWTKPGEGYSYATSSIHLVSVILRHLTGKELDQFVEERIAKPLGWGRWGWGYRRPEVTHTCGGGGIAPRPTDMLRFAYLLLREGRWGDRQVIPAQYIREAVRRRSRYNPHYPYGLQFTVNDDGHVAGAPRDAFWKTGSGGHAFYVVPSLDLVIWKLGGRDQQYDDGDSPGHDGSREGWKLAVDENESNVRTLEIVAAAVQSK